MISISLITFFGSLISISALIGKKLLSIKNSGEYYLSKEASFELPYIDEVKHGVKTSIKKLENVILILILRIYMKTTNYFKTTSKKIKKNLRNKILKNEKHIAQPEVSKFLKMVSDYKVKIKEIKHQIKKEENKS